MADLLVIDTTPDREPERPDDGPGWFICADCREDYYEGEVCCCREPDPEDILIESANHEGECP